MMEINQEKAGPIEIVAAIPASLSAFKIAASQALAFSGHQFQALMQEFKGTGFSVWYTRYWMQAPTVLQARAAIPVLELRITLKQPIGGTWDKVANPIVPVHCFQLGYVPYIITRAVFDAPVEYETFDIHFEVSFLEKLGVDYKALDLFLNKVHKQEPAELAPQPHRCSHIMLDCIHAILHNGYSAAGKEQLLQHSVSNLLIAALEIVGKEVIHHLPLTAGDIEALHTIKGLIEVHLPEYLGNDKLLANVYPHLNAFKLNYGFKRLFGINPYDYYQSLRFELGKDLLRKGLRVEEVAFRLEYESATTFIKAFRARFGYTPKVFQKNNGGLY